MRLSEKICLLIAVVAGALMSCSKVSCDVEMPICFSAYDVTTTKASEYFDNGDAVGIFAYYLEGGLWTQEVRPDLMNNVSLEKTAQGWTYSPIVYWPSMSLNQLRFYAYAPHADLLDPGELSLLCNDGKAPELKFHVTDGKTDLLASVPVQMSRPEGDAPVILELNHVLGKLQFKFAVPSSGSFSYVKRITLYGINKAAVFTWDGDSQTCAASGELTDLQLSSSLSDGCFVNTTVHTVIDQFTSYLIPGKIDKMGVVLNNNEEEMIDLSEDPLEIEAGKMLSISFTIHLTGLTVDAKIVPWVEGGIVTGGIK